jgi:Family of unknown function (DUF6221)
VDIVEFLTARYDEDEALARDSMGGPWRCTKYAHHWVVTSPYDPHGVVTFEDIGHSRSTPEHIARHDPARVLADIAVKRQIVELHAPGGGPPPFKYVYCLTCGSGEPCEYPTDWPCDTLKLLAAPYADHSDFDPSWAVDAAD